jgi:hypothetical protein
LQDHAAHLLRQVDAYATGDYEGAYGLGREGYEHMFMVGETLATAIARQLPAKFPGLAAPPNTATLDEHTTHHPAGLTVPWLVLGVEVAVLVAGTGMVLLGRRARRLPSVRLRSGLRRP